MTKEAGSTTTHAALILTARSEAVLLQGYPETVAQAISESPLVVVTAALTPETVMSHLQSAFDSLPPKVGLITVDEETRSAAPESAPQPLTDERVSIAIVGSPENIDRLGTVVDRSLQEWGEQTTVAVCSLTSVIEHASDQAVFRVLHRLTTHLRTIGATGHFFLDPTVVGQTMVTMIEPLFDDYVADRQPTASDQAAPEIFDEVHAAPIRQWIVAYLCKRSEPITIRDLADRLVQQNEPVTNLEGMDTDRVHQVLYHLHIPLSVEAGLVVTDTDHDRVEATQAADQFEFT